ncbi:MATE family efflux transporter [Aestuariibius sp. 2305UL40-4]|uniref:MATE family efflux transporter n=1 Tax=Aestuariibius violaceus TaxID=3234132 RepID=UPI00345F0A90
MAERDLTQGPVWRALTAVSAPMSLGILAVLSVGIVDAYFLGQLGGAPLAAVGFLYPVATAITSLAIGLSAGANTAVSQALGRKDDAAVPRRLALHAFGLGGILGTLVALIFWIGYPALFSVMGAGEEVLAEISEYAPWWAFSFPFLVVMMVTNAVFRAHGDGATSAIIMVFSAVVNMALTPLLIFGWWIIPGLETEGAGLATFIGRAVAAVAAIAYGIWKGFLQFRCAPFQNIPRSVREIGGVGLPAAFSNAINPAGMAAVTAAVATLGEAAVGGFGAATRVQSLALVALLALSSGIGPVVGQNWGADKPDRARKAVRQSWIFCALYGVSIALLLTLLAGPISSAIASDDEAARYTSLYLSVVSWSLVGYGILVTANAAMNARSKALWSMGLSLSRIFLIYLPFAWLGVWLFGYPGILAAAVAANIFAIWGAFVTGRATGLIETETGIVTGPAKAASDLKERVAD